MRVQASQFKCSAHLSIHEYSKYDTAVTYTTATSTTAGQVFLRQASHANLRLTVLIVAGSCTAAYRVTATLHRNAQRNAAVMTLPTNLMCAVADGGLLYNHALFSRQICTCCKYYC